MIDVPGQIDYNKTKFAKKTCREEENGKAMVKEKRATIKEVAALSGVSISTVSRYLSNPESVKPFAAYKIKDAVNQLGYVPNTFARSLRKGGSKTIGVVIPNLEFFFGKASKAISDYFYSQGYVTFICETDNESDKEKFFIQQLIDQQVAGMIIASSGLNTAFLQKTYSQYPNMVMLDRAEKIGSDIVAENYEETTYQLLIHMLKNKPCTRIELILGEETAVNTRLHMEGIHRALKEMGRDYSLVRPWYGCRRDGKIGDIMEAVLKELGNERVTILGFEPDFVEEVVISVNRIKPSALSQIDLSGFTMPKTMNKMGMNFSCIIQNPEYAGIQAAQVLQKRIENDSEHQEAVKYYEIKSMYHLV